MDIELLLSLLQSACAGIPIFVGGGLLFASYERLEKLHDWWNLTLYGEKDNIPFVRFSLALRLIGCALVGMGISLALLFFYPSIG